MSLSFRLNPEEIEFRKLNRDLYFMKENWEHLLELIIADSTNEEILKFASRLEEIPKYTEAQIYAREFIRSGANQIRKFSFENHQRSTFWEDHREEPVPLIEPPKNLIKKGSKSWIITI